MSSASSGSSVGRMASWRASSTSCCSSITSCLASATSSLVVLSVHPTNSAARAVKAKWNTWIRMGLSPSKIGQIGRTVQPTASPRLTAAIAKLFHLALGVVSGRPIALLDFAHQFLPPAVDDVEVVVGELAPLL